MHSLPNARVAAIWHVVVGVAVGLAGCSSSVVRAPTQETEPEPTQSARSSHGMVASAHPLATAAGNEILELGGNAADAAVATAFALAVVEHSMNGIGGRNQILIRTASGQYFGIDGHTEVPAGFENPQNDRLTGHRLVAIPGVVAGLERLSREHGRLPLSTVMEPAIRFADEGYRLLPGAASRHARAFRTVQQDRGASDAYLKPDGTSYLAGDLLRQPDLAATLRSVAADGGEDFYRGDVARIIATDIEAKGGFVSVDDLAGYEAVDGRIVRTTYRGYEVTATAAPAGGGLVVRSLNLMENFDLANMDEIQWAAIVNQSIAIAGESITEDVEDEDLAAIMDKGWAASKVDEIRVPEPGSGRLNLDRQDASGAGAGQPLVGDAATLTDWAGESWGEDNHHTTHLVVGDCAGMSVTLTQTLGPNFGASVVTPGLGFLYAETLGTSGLMGNLEPGDRPRTTIAPTILTKDGEVKLVLGAAGGFRILSAIVETISRYVDHGNTLDAAVAAPRVQPNMSMNFETGQFGIEREGLVMETTPENGWAQSVISALSAQGFEVTELPRYAAFGRVHALMYDAEAGEWIGSADLDWEGTAAGPSRSVCTQR